MNMKLDEGMTTLVVFIIVAATLSSAQSVVTTGIPGIMVDFNISSTMAQWIYSSYLLILGVMVPLTAFVTRRFKLKRILSTITAIYLELKKMPDEDCEEPKHDVLE